jgi:hypothetical protein
VNRWVVIAALVACKPGQESARHDDAAARSDAARADAPPPVDAKVADAKPVGPKETVQGKGFSCSLFDDGSVTCVGDIGFGAQAKTAQPTAVPGLTKAQRVYALGRAACAITDDAAVCWGDIDDHGRITHAGAHRLPTAVLGVSKELLDGAIEIAARPEAVCALRDDGTVWCAAPHPLCAPKPVKPAKKPPASKKKPGKPAAPPPAPEPKSTLEQLHVPKSAHLAFDRDGLCVQTASKAFECLDRADPCKSHPER